MAILRVIDAYGGSYIWQPRHQGWSGSLRKYISGLLDAMFQDCERLLIGYYIKMVMHLAMTTPRLVWELEEVHQRASRCHVSGW